MPSASGWAPLIAKYEAQNYDATPQLWTEYVTALQLLLGHAIYCGRSAAWFFEGSTNDLTVLAQVLPSLVDQASPYYQAFPSPLNETDLLGQSMASVRANFTTFNSGREHVLFMCSKRAFRERESVPFDEMDAQIRDAFSGYEEVIGVRSGFTQAFDRLVVHPAMGLLELHIDMCCPLNVEELTQFRITHISKLKQSIGALNGGSLQWLGDAKNLFPRIAQLYNAADGRVLSLGHATGTKSIKEERMRGRSLDLRDELFHKHGIEAIQNTDAYSIRKGWPSTSSTNMPSVAINGHFTSAGAAHAAVRHAIIDGCATPDDVDLIRSKLLI